MEKECALCGILFETPTATRLYCDDCLHHKKLRTKEINGSQRRAREILGPKVYEGVCPECGKEFKMWEYLTCERDGKVFCSNKCYSRDKKRSEGCVICGRNLAFRYTEENIDKTTFKYCSKECEQIAEDLKEQELRASGFYKNCLNCGKEFGRKDGKFCCVQCSREYQKKNRYVYVDNKPQVKLISAKRRCVYCHKIFTAQAEQPELLSDYCSRECRDKYNTAKRRATREAYKKKQLKESHESNCATCKAKTKECVWLSSNFTTVPEGTLSKDGKILYCPNYKS